MFSHPLLADSTSRLPKNAHLLRSPRPSSLQRTAKYASLLRISGALHLDIFDQPCKSCFLSNLLVYIPYEVPLNAKIAITV